MMSVCRFDVDALHDVARALTDAGSMLDDVGAAALSTVSGFAGEGAAGHVAACLSSTQHVVGAWAGSILSRHALLAQMRAIGLAGDPDDGQWGDRLVASVEKALSDTQEAAVQLAPFDVQAALVRWVAALPLAPMQRDRWIGSTLATMFDDAAGRPQEMDVVATLVEQHLDSAEAAAAFFNSLDPGYLLAMGTAAGVNMTNGSGVSDMMRRFAAALAVASHSEELRMAPAELIDSPYGGQWLNAGGFSVEFLVDALVAALATDAFFPTWAVGSEGQRFHLPDDPRAAALLQIAAHGVAAAAIVVPRLAEEGLLDELVGPRHAYPDGGAPAGALLGLFGHNLDAVTAPLAVEIMEIIATGHPSQGVAAGAAEMVGPHLAVFADELHLPVLPPTSLAAALSTHHDAEGLLEAFSRKLMGHDQAAAQLFAGFAYLLVGAVRAGFDPSDPASVAEPFGAAGGVFDRLLGSYVQVNFEHAKREVAARRLIGGIISVALDLAIAAGPATRVPALAAEAVTSVSVNALSSRIADSGGDVTAPEGVLLAAADLEDGMVDRGAMLLAVLLHETGQLELPEAWYQHGILRVPSRIAWEAYAIDLQAAGFPYFEWFNHAVSIGGYASTALPTDD